MMRVLTAILILASAAGTAAAQTPAGRLIEAGRAQLEAPNPDSAAALLETALQPGRGATLAERTRAFQLYAIAQLLRDNLSAARAALRQALQLDPALRLDSLSFFSDALEREFAAARAELSPAASQLTVRVGLPADTTVPVDGGALRIDVRPSYPARVITVIAPADQPGSIVWSDSQQVVAAATGTWNLRGRDGALVAPGRYELRASAADSSGIASQPIQRILVISRVAADTEPLPPALAAAAFEPETLLLRHGAPAGLAWGLGIGAVIAAGGSALGNATLNSGRSADGTAYAVAGGVALASVLGFLKGSRVRPLPASIERNAQLRLRDAQERERIARANAAVRAAADVRIALERAGP